MTINCTINTGTKDSSWGSASHHMLVLSSAATRYMLTSDQDKMINANFVMSYRTNATQILGNCIVEAPASDSKGSFVLFLCPPEPSCTTHVRVRQQHDVRWLTLFMQSFGRNIVFLVDHSGSMAGEPMRSARESLSQALQQLSPNDQFGICGAWLMLCEYPGVIATMHCT
jgi:Mg-chelatase subunit ChlD